MQHIHMFQLNVDKDNHVNGNTDFYVNVLARWNSKDFYSSDRRPMVFIKFIDLSTYDLTTVKDWHPVIAAAEKLAEQHFAELARIERINQAKAVLAVEENPVMERLIINHFTPVS